MIRDSNIYVLPTKNEPRLRSGRALQPPKISLLGAELLIAVVGLLLVTYSLDLVIPSAILSLFSYSIFAISFCFILGFHLKTLLQIICRDPYLFIFMMMACLSFAWSDFPSSTIRECFDFFRIATFAIFLSIAFSPKQILNLLLVNYFIAAILSLMISVAVPSVGIDHIVHIGAWKGIYAGKNAMGARMAVGSLIFYICLLFSERRLTPRNLVLWFGLCLSVFLVLMTTSKTSLVVLCSISLALTAFKRFRWNGKSTVIILLLSLLAIGFAALFIFSNWNMLMIGLGKDPTLSGRTIIWQASLAKFMERPWYGFGLGAFWTAGSEQLAYVGQFFF